MMQSEKQNRIIHQQLEFRGRKFQLSLRPDADESVVAEIFKWQEYKAAEGIIRQACWPILDVGAHIGIFSLYAKALNPAANVYALEPEEDNFRLLKQNLAANRLSGIKIFRTALAGRSGSRQLKVEPDSINHYLLPAEAVSAGREEKVAAVSLGEFLNKRGLPTISLMKMDIEGGEYEIFEGMSEEDYARLENIILEYHDVRGRQHGEVETLLRQHGFGVQLFPSRFEKGLGFLLARNKRSRREARDVAA